MHDIKGTLVYSAFGGESGSMATLWYCAMVKHQQEAVAEVNLERQGFTAFFPRYLSRCNERTGKPYKEPIVRYAFPGYGFVRFDKEADPWRKIWSTNGIKQLMSWSVMQPAKVPTRIIRELQAMYAPDSVYEPGMLLKVTKGKYAGEIGFCEWADDDRVQLLLTVLDKKQTQIQSLVTLARQNVSLTRWSAP
jgi:transcriptional antiterminator RfaH